MVLTNKSIENYLERCRIILESLKIDTVIKPVVLEYGYTDERLNAGLLLYNQVATLYDQLLTARGSQSRLSLELKEKLDEASIGFSFLAEICRTAFADSTEIYTKELGLKGDRKRSINSFLTQATNFYNNLLDKSYLLEKISDFAITTEKVQAEMDKLTALKALHQAHATAMGECQYLNQERDRQLKRLKRFMKQLKTVLFRIYPKGSRQILERVNIFVRNRKKTKTGSDNPPAEENNSETNSETPQETPQEEPEENPEDDPPA